MFRAGDLKPVSQDGWSISHGAFDCGPAGGRLVYEAAGQMLLLGLNMPKSASGKVRLSVDGADPVALSGNGPNRPVVTGLQPGKHLVCITVESYAPVEGETANHVQIWWGGGAGMK